METVDEEDPYEYDDELAAPVEHPAGLDDDELLLEGISVINTILKLNLHCISFVFWSKWVLSSYFLMLCYFKVMLLY